ncbi:class I SAM-dependent methyltransferase [Parasphingopyxis algicola]|uniref:class I SAM-dependent methyltransferase n=1 Tax=Parasphingopyxis algicola TaxID=2026624 RepID=UPI0015A1E2DC|nr:class I SAM-dependent methyltransferase [Parasphingopyxis algicola]QLC26067.1 class I SAM-dependent methyltransferase [Parasphingopyxis algicola]
MTDRLWDIFFDIHSGLPRQGPGDDESTRRALAACDGLPDGPAICDIGCGPGMQTLALAEALSDAGIVAVDFHQPYLDDLAERAQRAGCAERIELCCADMADLPFDAARFDLIWSEGAAYVIGVDAALDAWRPLLRSRACLAFTELVWLTSDPPDEAAAFFAEEYPAMRGADAVAAGVEAKGYEMLGRFTLPDAAWWKHYYTPLAARLLELEKKYAGDAEALGMIATSEREIEIRRRFGNSYGYEFLVARKAS